ncbi:MAG: hypothetical protein M5U14_13135 [Acidimicrobiia bacterium]|nr:hypothetical protein [Acidimicrobiia bacterium]
MVHELFAFFERIPGLEKILVARPGPCPLRHFAEVDRTLQELVSAAVGTDDGTIVTVTALWTRGLPPPHGGRAPAGRRPTGSPTSCSPGWAGTDHRRPV